MINGGIIQRTKQTSLKVRKLVMVMVGVALQLTGWQTDSTVLAPTMFRFHAIIHLIDCLDDEI